MKNTEKRISDLTQQLQQVLQQRSLNRHETLKLKGRLGFADGFLHRRLGALVLKRLVDHAYSFSNVVDSELAAVLELMIKRLQCAGPKRVDANTVNEWSIFTDASFETELGSGGLGGVLVDCLGNCRAWFSLKLEPSECKLLGADSKETIIYELELLACCIAMDVWGNVLASTYPVLYGDNDSVRFASIRGTGLGLVAEVIMKQHLEAEVNYNTNVWFARVPSEANIADIPSRFLQHAFLQTSMDESSKSMQSLAKFLKNVKLAREEVKRKGEAITSSLPKFKKESISSCTK